MKHGEVTLQQREHSPPLSLHNVSSPLLPSPLLNPLSSLYVISGLFGVSHRELREGHLLRQLVRSLAGGAAAASGGAHTGDNGQL